MAKTESIKGEPMIAPCAIFNPAGLFKRNEDKIAIMGTMVSGSVVPITARIPPVALFESFNFEPKLSIAFVNNTQAKIIPKRYIKTKIPFIKKNIYFSLTFCYSIYKWKEKF